MWSALPWHAARWVCAFLLFLSLPPFARAADGLLVLDRALAAESDSARFPESAPIRLVPLPDDWAETHPRYAGVVWYRLLIDAPDIGQADRRVPSERASHELLGLYLERACANVEVHLNGTLLLSGGSMNEPVTRNCHRPQLIALPASLLRQRGNALDLRVVGYPLQRVASRDRAGGLSALVVGPYAAVASRYERQHLVEITLPQLASGVLLLLGCFMGVLGLMNRRETHVLYFAAVSIGWAAVSAGLWLRDLPLSNDLVELLIASWLPLLTLAAVRFMMRYAGWRHRAIDTALLAQCIIVPASLAVAGPSRLFVLASSWYLVLALEAAAAMVFCLWACRRWRPDWFWPAALTLPVIAILVGVELAAQQMPVDPPLILHVARIGVPVAFVIIGLSLLRQFGRAVRAAEAGRQSLELRIRDVTAEIEKNFAQLAEMRVEQVTERERKRIAADLHDDLGAKLLTIVHTSESERISSLAREALEEMRLSVRGLTGKPVRLSDALGDWRAEVMSRLSQAGIEADWNAPIDEQHTFSARSYVQTTRIMREAVSNIIKHSGASRCSVQSVIAEGDFQIVIQDNGHGIPMELDGKLDRGHGMASMKHRAKQLQGQCLVESGPGYGTVIRLTLPL
jgi:signal transduction histidine kinase